MRRLLLPLLLLLTQCSLHSTASLPAPPSPDVTLSIAIPDGRRLTPSTPLHIIIQNTSGHPQSHYQEWNSWGYFALTLHWSDTLGHSGTLSKVPIGWTMNYPSTTTLQPNEFMVRDITLDPKLWQGLPTTHGDTRLTLTAIYHPTELDKDSPAYTGTATSPPVTLTLYLP